MLLGANNDYEAWLKRNALMAEVLRLTVQVLDQQHATHMRLLRSHSRNREYHGQGEAAPVAQRGTPETRHRCAWCTCDPIAHRLIAGTGPFCTFSYTHNYDNLIHADQVRG